MHLFNIRACIYMEGGGVGLSEIVFVNKSDGSSCESMFITNDFSRVISVFQQINVLNIKILCQFYVQS